MTTEAGRGVHPLGEEVLGRLIRGEEESRAGRGPCSRRRQPVVHPLRPTASEEQTGPHHMLPALVQGMQVAGSTLQQGCCRVAAGWEWERGP